MKIKLNLKRKKISNVQLGDTVYCYDENNDEFCVNNVTDVFTPTIKKEYQQEIQIGKEVVHTSSIHPFYDAETQTWKEAQEFDSIRGLDENGKIVEIKNNTKFKSESDEKFYDFTVENLHNYFVGKNNTFALTHNSATTFFPIWHQEIEDILVLKNNKGTEDNRVRKLDYGIQLSKLFYERFIRDEDITLFSPHDVPGLYDSFGLSEFDDLYVKYEQDSSIPKKTVRAQDLFLSLIKERAETGRIYIMNIDHCNIHSSYKDHISMSNLCVAGDTKIRIKYPEPEYEDYGGDIWNWYVVEKEIEIEELEQYISDRDSRISRYAAYEGDPCEDVPQIEVISYNIQSNQEEWKPITAFGETSSKAKVMKITDEESGKSIVVTPEHEIFTKNRGYVMARLIKEDDQLVFENGSFSEKLKIEHALEEIPVYDITVKDNHNFFANGILISNCMEITEPTNPIRHIDDDDNEIATCILSAVNVGKVRSDEELEELCDLAVRALEELIDYQDYPVRAAENFTKNRRSLGIGYIGLAHYLAKLGFNYDSVEAWDAVHRLSESFQYYLLKASNQLAKERGACNYFSRTKYADGILPIDTYKKDIDEIVNMEYQHDWESLRNSIQQYGLRHSTLSAQMPSESCLFWKHKIITNNGEKDFHEICEMNDIDWKNIEQNDLVGWYNLNSPIQVETLSGNVEVDKIYYNGMKSVITIFMENGKQIKCTPTHKFLVRLDNGDDIWKLACDLDENDDIVEF